MDLMQGKAAAYTLLYVMAEKSCFEMNDAERRNVAKGWPNKFN